MDEHCTLAQNIFTIVNDQQHIVGCTEKLLYMKFSMLDIIIPYLEQHYAEAIEFRNTRDIENIKLFKLMHSVNDELCVLLTNQFTYVKIMSSINAQLNLPVESDIDFGIIIINLNNQDGSIDNQLYASVANKLESNGFKFKYIFNEQNSSNRYYSYEKNIDGVDIEVKIRDHETTKVMLSLHDYLDTKLTEKEITLFTYAKHILKQYDKKNIGSNCYEKFKKILYEYAFAEIKGGFCL